MILPTLWLALSGCAPSTETADPVASALAQPLPDDSLYQLDVDLVTQTGAHTTLAEHRGHPTLISMFYASCPLACPMLIQEVQSLEADLPPELRSDVRVLLVSLDPARDTPEKLAGVVDTYSLDPARWTLTRTEADSVREVAAVLGIQYRSLDGGEMNHSSVITLLDRQGRVQARVDGLGRDTGALVAALEGAAAD